MKHRRLKRLALIIRTGLATTEALPGGSIIPVRELIADSREDIQDLRAAKFRCKDKLVEVAPQTWGTDVVSA